MTESDTSWQQHFQQLEEYKLTHGNCNVPLEYGRHPHLGKWLMDQRKSYRTGYMKDDRKGRLNGIGILWSQIELKWELRFQELIEYKETNGDCNVPNSAFSSNIPLGNWVFGQRQASKRDRLSKERKDKLDSIGFGWGRGRHADSWDSRFQQLVEYKRTHGNCGVPFRYEINPKLGSWVCTQRSLLKWKKLRIDRVAKLESILFLDEKSGSDRLVLCAAWDICFQQLVEYKRTHGDCDVPHHYESNPKLGHWVYEQRFSLKDKIMPEARVAKLESIGFQATKSGYLPIVVAWDTRFQQLVEYKRTRGNCGAPFRYESNQDLGRWVCRQRHALKRNELRNDRVARLESIEFQVDGQAKTSDAWDTFFEELREYVRTHGDCNVPESYHLNPSLVLWVWKQRHDYSLKCGGEKSAMTAEREAKLNALGFLWEKRESPRVGSNDNNGLYPDEVTSER